MQVWLQRSTVLPRRLLSFDLETRPSKRDAPLKLACRRGRAHTWGRLEMHDQDVVAGGASMAQTAEEAQMEMTKSKWLAMRVSCK